MWTLLAFSAGAVGQIPMAAGILQGCPLSGTLFALATDPLVRARAVDVVHSPLGACFPLCGWLGIYAHVDCDVAPRAAADARGLGSRFSHASQRETVRRLAGERGHGNSVRDPT